MLATVTASNAGAAPPRLNGSQLEQQGAAVNSSKARSSRVAMTDQSLLKIRSKKLIPVMVKFDYDGAASYMGGVASYAATSPSVTGRSLRRNAKAVTRYTDYLAKREASIVSGIAAKVPGAKVLFSYRIAYGGVAMMVPGNQIKAILSVPGVDSVQKDDVRLSLTDNSPHFIGADLAWEELEGGLSGQNVTIGTIDTGIYPEHPSFDPAGEPPPIGGPYGCEFGDGTDPQLGDPFTCNNKLVGAYAFLGTYGAVNGFTPGQYCNTVTLQCSARDDNGHGTHTASTSGGNQLATAELFGVDRGPISGIAPGAHVIMYRACFFDNTISTSNCFASDSAAAVQQAILDDVDVINFSIGGGANPYSDAVELAFLDAYAANIVVNASAGNSGPGSGTADHGGPWEITVGASTQDRAFVANLHLSATGGDTLDVPGTTITAGLAATPVILAADVPGYTGGALCLNPFAPGSVTGMVVACQRGTNARVAKGYNVMQGGGAGFILYNTAVTDVETDNHWIPAVHLNINEGAQMLAFLDAHSGVTATWTTGVSTPSPGDVMASFSSRGPVGEFLKPDVTSVGVQVLAGMTPQPTPGAIVLGPPGQTFQSIAGTSMSSPHSAGSSALVRDGHLDWTPGQIKSALMTSAVTDVVKEDFTTPATPFDMGAGSVRPNLGLHPSLTFDVSAADYYASATDPLGRIHLNLPSIQANPMPGRITTTRTGVNVSGSTLSFHVETTTPENSSIEVSPSSFTVPPGDSAALTITIHGGQLADGQWYFGEIRLVNDSQGPAGVVNSDVHLPVSLFKTQTDIALSNVCESTNIGVGSSTDCSATITNNSPEDANVSAKIRSTAPSVASLSGTTSFNGSLTGALAPNVDGIVPGGTGYGYIPLSDLGCSPQPGMGDETLINFDTPVYSFGGETYNQLAVTSNGYAKMGEGSSDDLNYIPQVFPDPASPNNVLAPFWTDLNVAAGGAVYVCTLTDDINDWIVVDWENVPTFGTTELQSFEIWIQTDAEKVTYAFGETNGDGAADGLTIGAENRDGTSGVNLDSIPGDGSEVTVLTSPGTGGGSVTLDYVATGNSAGAAVLRAIMSSDVTNGETVKAVTITVG
jgi:hypothetical protein